MKIIRSLLCLMLSAFACGAQTNTSVDLAWDYTNQVPAISGFKIYYGTQSRVYTQSIFASGANTTNATVPELDLGTLYYFTATAVGVDSVEGPFSNEVSFQTPPDSENEGAPTLMLTGMRVHRSDPTEPPPPPPPPPPQTCTYPRHQNTNAPSSYSLLTHNRWMATPFLSSSTYNPCSGDVSLVRIGTGDIIGTLEFSIYQGALPNFQASPVWSSTVNVATLPRGVTNLTQFAFSLENLPQVLSGQTNWLVIKPTYTFTGTGQWLRWLLNLNPSTIGTKSVNSVYRSYDQGMTWTLDAQRRGLFHLRSLPPQG